MICNSFWPFEILQPFCFQVEICAYSCVLGSSWELWELSNVFLTALGLYIFCLFLLFLWAWRLPTFFSLVWTTVRFSCCWPEFALNFLHLLAHISRLVQNLEVFGLCGLFKGFKFANYLYSSHGCTSTILGSFLLSPRAYRFYQLLRLSSGPLWFLVVMAS